MTLPEELKQRIFDACNSCRTSVDEFMPECQKELYCPRCKEVIAVVASFLETARKGLHERVAKRKAELECIKPSNETSEETISALLFEVMDFQEHIDAVFGGEKK